VAEGRALGKQKNYEIGSVIGSLTLLGQQNYHQETVVGESEGVLLALRIEDFY
jgi:hypothetical protein